jgi:hypothetical protein
VPQTWQANAFAEDGRLFVVGDVAYVVRADRAGPPSQHAFALGRGAALDSSGTPPPASERRSGQALAIGDTARPGGDPSAVVVAARATREGLWVLVTSARAGSATDGVVGWISSQRVRDAPPPLRASVPLSVDPVQGLVPLGRRLLVPADAGVLSIPLR